MSPYRVVNVRHLQQVLGAAILLHLNGLSAPLCGYAVIFGEVCVRRHLEVATLEDDLVDVVLVSPWGLKRYQTFKVNQNYYLIFNHTIK